MTDVSDPRGAGRRDRRQAVRLVDEAYASGRISAADRALRLERVAAAATLGDLATVTRDLAAREAPGAPPQATPTTPTRPASPVAPLPASVTPAAAPGPPPAADAPATWPQNLHRAPAGPVPPPADRPWFRGPLGCLVVAVVVIFLLPFIFSIVVFGIAFTSFDDLGSSFEESGGFEDGIASTLDWGVMVDDLEAATVGAPVQSLTLADGSAEAVVGEGTGVVTWRYDEDGWSRTGESRPGGGSRPAVDLAAVDPFVLDELGVRAPVDWDGEDDNAMDPDVTASIDAASGTPLIAVTSPGSGGVPQTVRYTFDGSEAVD